MTTVKTELGVYKRQAYHTSYDPGGTIASTDVQSAIEEAVSEAAPADAGYYVTSANAILTGGTVVPAFMQTLLDDTDAATARTTLDVYSSSETDAAIAAAVTAEDLDFAGDSGTGSVDLDSQSLTIATGNTSLVSAAASQTLTISLAGVLEDLDTLGAAASDGQFIVATGAGTFAYESGATVRTSLGLAIGTDVQAYDADTAKLDLAQTWTAVQTFSNTGLHLLDTGGNHDYIITPGEDATADRTLTLDLNDADRTLSLPSPTFTNLTQTGYHDLTEISEPSTPGANVLRVYSVNNGNGKTLGKVKDSSGNAAFLGGPEILYADRTYYVRTDGSDSNTGLVDSAGGAFLTLQAAVDAAYELDLNGFAVTIDVGNGTYTSGVDCVGQMRGIKAGVTPLTITGDTSTPTNVIINTTDDNCFKAELGAFVTVQGFQVAATISAGDVVSAACLAAFSGGQIIHGNMDFDETDGHHKHASESGRVATTTDHTISGGTGGRHIHAANRGYQSVKNCTVTLTGTPDFATGFLATAAADTEFINCTFSGSATGQRFFLHYGSTLRTDQAASTIDTYFPGDSDGLAIGSKYDNLDSTIRLRNGGSIVFDIADENIVIVHSDTNDILLFNGASGGYRFDNSVKSSSSSGGIGYVAGAGGAVTQATSKSTAVTLNAVCGRITMDSAALADGALVSFTCNNSSAEFGDTVVVNHLTTGTPGGYSINARSLSGSIQFNVRNISGGSLSEAIILVFSIIKAVNA